MDPATAHKFSMMVCFFIAAFIFIVIEFYVQREREFQCKNLDNEICAVRFSFALDDDGEKALQAHEDQINKLNYGLKHVSKLLRKKILEKLKATLKEKKNGEDILGKETGKITFNHNDEEMGKTQQLDSLDNYLQQRKHGDIFET